MDRRILVVDDDRLIREMISDALGAEGFRVCAAASAPDALQHLAGEDPFDVVVTDLSMREMDGLALLERIKREDPKAEVIILTGYASLESALEAMRLGAAEYLRKPIRPLEIVYAVKRVILRARLLSENESLRGHLQTYEASRTLTACLESSDVLPLTLDILLRIFDGARAVGRLIHATPRPSDGIHLRGFDAQHVRRLREQIEQGKLFDPASLEGSAHAGSAGEQERLARSGIDYQDLLVLPLHLDRRVVGGIWILSADRSFGEEEIRRAELVVAQSELALANAERLLQAREKAFVDDVTDLYNARYLLSALDREVNRASRTELELSVLFLDLDRFKTVNDSYGHIVGSSVLRELGQLLSTSVRVVDTVGRYGGDEFTVILTDTGYERALQVAERIRRAVAESPFGSDRGLRLALTCSIGVATFGRHGRDRESLLDAADKAMYLGKAAGRNRVCSADELTSPGQVGTPVPRSG